MKLTSSVFLHSKSIPALYTCDGQNINPPLNISEVPASTKSLVLIMDDPDIPQMAKDKYNIDVWDHWIVFNILPTTTNIEEGKNPEGVVGKNTSGQNAYGGPCPPDGEHRYLFKLYALDTLLDLKEGVSKKEVELAMEGHLIDQTELIGLYNRQR